MLHKCGLRVSYMIVVLSYSNILVLACFCVEMSMGSNVLISENWNDSHQPIKK